MNIHRYYCLAQLEQPCLGKNPGFMSTSRKRRTSQHSIKKIHCELLTHSMLSITAPYTYDARHHAHPCIKYYYTVLTDMHSTMETLGEK